MGGATLLAMHTVCEDGREKLLREDSGGDDTKVFLGCVCVVDGNWDGRGGDGLTGRIGGC